MIDNSDRGKALEKEGNQVCDRNDTRIIIFNDNLVQPLDAMPMGLALIGLVQSLI